MILFTATARGVAKFDTPKEQRRASRAVIVSGRMHAGRRVAGNCKHWPLAERRLSGE